MNVGAVAWDLLSDGQNPEEWRLDSPSSLCSSLSSDATFLSVSALEASCTCLTTTTPVRLLGVDFFLN